MPQNPLRPSLPVALLLALVAFTLLPAEVAQATPQFARTYGVSCNSCHTIAPQLNERGLAFEARGYRGSPEFEKRRQPTLPLAVWITGRHEQQFSRGFDDTYLPKLELISAGAITDDLTYFVEWRTIDFGTDAEGARTDRSGRFEDLFVEWEPLPRFTFQVGQYRSLKQIDVSRRLSISEPAVFSTSLPGDEHPNPRVESLRAFAPSARSPGFTLGYQSIEGDTPAEGLFHYATVPFVGELSIPITRQARREASFELRPNEPKGVFLETYYRHGLNTIGAHTFINDDRWQLTGVGTAEFHNLQLTGALGVDDRRGARSRIRSSMQGEYLLLDLHDHVRPGVGFRVEHITRDGLGPAYIPYIAVSGPNTDHTFLLQLQYRAQRERDALILDLSLMF